MTAVIPESHRDLVSDDSKPYAVLSTIMENGGPHATPIWFDMEGDNIRLNTVRGRVKDRNMQAQPRVALTVLDANSQYRYLLIRGKIVAQTEQGAIDHIFQLADKYDGRGEFTVPEGQVRVIYTLEPTSVVAG